MLFLTMFQLKAQNNEVETLPKNYVGINLSGVYSTNTVNSGKQTILNINTAPFYGRRVNNFVFAIGMSIGYNQSKFPYSSTTYGSGTYRTEKAIELLVLPTIRYYTKFKLFFAGSFEIGKGFGESSTPFIDNRSINYRNMEYTSDIIGGAIGIGYAIEAGKSFLIEPLISVQKIFNVANYKYNTANPNIYYPSYNFNSKTNYLNFNISLGTTYRF